MFKIAVSKIYFKSNIRDVNRFVAGGDREDHEDEEEDRQRSASNGAGGDAQEHVPAAKEAHQAADRVAHRARVHDS